MAENSSFSITFLPGLVGRRVIGGLTYVVDLTVFAVQAIKEWRERGSFFDRATRSSLVTQIIFTGIDALPVITLLGIAIGLSITAQLFLMIRMFGTTNEVVDVLSQVVAQELGSLLTAILLIGRSGSAIAVDLGNMRLNKEIEGLGLLGINVNHFFVTPRILSTSICQVALAVYFTVIAVVSGILFASFFVSVGYFKYLAAVPLAFNPLDMVFFLAKNLLFGIIIGATACFHGLQVRNSCTELPQQAQRAIVNSIIMVFTLDGMIALVLP